MTIDDIRAACHRPHALTGKSTHGCLSPRFVCWVDEDRGCVNLNSLAFGIPPWVENLRYDKSFRRTWEKDGALESFVLNPLLAKSLLNTQYHARDLGHEAQVPSIQGRPKVQVC